MDPATIAAVMSLVGLAAKLGQLGLAALTAKTDADRQRIMSEAHAEVDGFKASTQALRAALAADDAAADQALRDAKQP